MMPYILSISEADPIIAFTVSASTDQNVQSGGKFAFDTVFTNIGGGFKPSTDFVCPVTGHYLFSFTMATQSQVCVWARVTLDGAESPRIYADSLLIGNGSASHTGMAYCTQVQRVYVESEGNSNAIGGLFCNFSGMLVRAENEP